LSLPAADWAEADARWRVLYEEEPPPLLAGAREALRRVVRAGCRAGIVTSGTRARVLGDLMRHLVGEMFEAVVCAGDTAERKPHPEPLRHTLRLLGVAPTEAAYAGDSPEDVAMARAAGVFAVAIPGGFPNRGALVAAGPDLVAADLATALTALGIA
jgi:HAD superfamily hydrolase (TIGR01549 family)